MARPGRKYCCARELDINLINPSPPLSVCMGIPIMDKITQALLTE